MRHGTYSIVARDATTGELGAAVQSHWFSVGGIVPWARAGVGAVATQAIAEPAYGPDLLELLAAGAAANDALERRVAVDAQSAVRQVAVVDAAGRVAAHTGHGCIPHAGHRSGAGFCCQANIMATATVWDAMAEAFPSAAGALAERMLAALDAADAQGGDVRGRQSAALVVAPAAGEHWRRSVELRVEDHAEPLGELRRLLVLHRAYELAERADALTGEGRFAQAAPLYEQASALAPGSDELLFWSALAAAQAGDLASARSRFERAARESAGWAELLDRLTPELSPGAPALRAALHG